MDAIEQLKTFMENKGISQKKLAEKLGWSPSGLNNILQGREPLGIKRLLHISKTLGIKFEGLDIADFGTPVPPPIGTVPVISFIKGGANGFFDDMGYPVGEGFRKVNRPYDLTDPHAYGVEVRGDSMYPKFEEKDIVLVSPAKEVVSGDYVVLKTKAGDGMVKRIRFKDGHVILESVNPAYEPILLQKKELLFCHKIVWVKPRS